MGNFFGRNFFWEHFFLEFFFQIFFPETFLGKNFKQQISSKNVFSGIYGNFVFGVSHRLSSILTNVFSNKLPGPIQLELLET